MALAYSFAAADSAKAPAENANKAGRSMTMSGFDASPSAAATASKPAGATNQAAALPSTAAILLAPAMSSATSARSSCIGAFDLFLRKRKPKTRFTGGDFGILAATVAAMVQGARLKQQHDTGAPAQESVAAWLAWGIS